MRPATLSHEKLFSELVLAPLKKRRWQISTASGLGVLGLDSDRFRNNYCRILFCLRIRRRRGAAERSSNMFKQNHLVACAALATLLGLASASAQTASPKSGHGTSSQSVAQAEKRFLTEAIQGDLAEMNIGKLAQDKGQADEVKQFGQMLERDHGDHLKEAEQMAEQMGITAPNTPSAEQQATHDILAKLFGDAFDKEFKRAMVKDRQWGIAKYRGQAQGNGPLAQFAQQTVPTLEKHLKHAQALGRPAPTTGKGGTNR